LFIEQSSFVVRNLLLVEKNGDEVTTRNLMLVRFVPFIRTPQGFVHVHGFEQISEVAIGVYNCSCMLDIYIN